MMMTLRLYQLDRKAQEIALNVFEQNPRILGEAHKMRATAAYGLERFWGEHLRLAEEPDKSNYWQKTWQALAEILDEAGLNLPNDRVAHDNPQQIRAMAEKLWALNLDHQRVALSVLIQLCDCLVWWVQRYK